MDKLTARTVFSCCEQSIINTLCSIPRDQFYVSANGSVVDLEEFVHLNPDGFFQLHFRCVGGKGGFGSLLRSFRVNKSTNQDMCRDLNGRRLGAVEKEKKIRTWIENQAEREAAAEEKRKQRIAKLKAKPIHDYADSEKYESERKDIEEKTETAFEDGFNQFLKAKTEKSKSPSEESSDSDSDVDLDFLDLPGTSKRGVTKSRKRKASKEEVDSGSAESTSTGDEIPEKKEKVDVDGSPSSTTPTVEATTKKLDTETVKTAEKSDPEKKAVVEVVSSQPEPVVDVKPEVPKDFPPIDLESIDSVDELEALGLHHLKHALEARSLKCGGSLQERASRLFSVKGVKPADYPKNIRAAPPKKQKK